MYLIIGNYISDNIRYMRNLPAPNPAASNRMIKLAKALKTVGKETMILSAASAATIKYNPHLIYKEHIAIENQIKVLYSSALAIPLLSMLWEICALPMYFIRLNRTKNIEAIIIYCYYPSSVLIAIIAKIFRIKIIEDLEDIVEPRWSDWISGQILSGLRQIIGLLLMNIMMKLSNTVIIPTKRFYNYIPVDKDVIEISGCLNVERLSNKPPMPDNKIQVLFSGLLVKEQGIDLLLETLSVIENKCELFNKYQFNISGYGGDDNYIHNQLIKLNNVKVVNHGYVDNTQYNNLIERADICLVLQNPNGFYGRCKTPSKGFEYISKGKLVIISNVGDYALLPEKTLIILKEYNSTELIKILEEISYEDIVTISKNAYTYASREWSFESIGKLIIN